MSLRPTCTITRRCSSASQRHYVIRAIVVHDSDDGFLRQPAGLIPPRWFEDDVVGLPLAVSLARVHQLWLLTVSAPAWPSARVQAALRNAHFGAGPPDEVGADFDEGVPLAPGVPPAPPRPRP
jgi:hypothetical protein